MKTGNYLLSFLIAGAAVLTFQSCGPAYIAVVPARPVFVMSPSPYYGAIWIDGGWNARTGSYNAGYWDHPRQGRTYYSGKWNQGPRGYSYKGGKWK